MINRKNDANVQWILARKVIQEVPNIDGCLIVIILIITHLLGWPIGNVVPSHSPFVADIKR